MNVTDARRALRWALFNPDAAEAAGTKMLETVPQVMTTVGAFMLSEWLSKKLDSVQGGSPLSKFVTILRTPGEAMNFLEQKPLTGARSELAVMPPPSMSMQQVEGAQP